jgi:sucrose porin
MDKMTFKTPLAIAIAAASLGVSGAAMADTTMEERLAELEARIIAAEQRAVAAEQRAAEAE